MRIFKYRRFYQWAKKEKISNAMLKKAIIDINRGLFDVSLGNGLFKKRIARKGQSKQKGYRAVLAFKKENRAIFMYGFAKNDRSNISHHEEEIFKKLASYYLEMKENQIDLLIKNGELIEVLES